MNFYPLKSETTSITACILFRNISLLNSPLLLKSSKDSTQTNCAAHLYLGVRTTTTSTQRLRAGKSEKEKTIEITLDRNEEIVDVHENVKLKLKLVCRQVPASEYINPPGRDHNTSLRSEVRQYELSFHKKHKEMVLNLYLPHVLEKAKAIKKESNMIKLHTVEYERWDANDTVLKHPMNFETLALDSELKRTPYGRSGQLLEWEGILQKYREILETWILIIWTSRHGQVSLIAAMANHLKFDIYDSYLTDIQSNSDLRFLLLSMPSQSILVIEHIDCSFKLENRESEDASQDQKDNKVTLSGILNFIDGLWSCCGDERIIIFTTNHRERLDPALLRPGRMDIRIHMSYCTTSLFKQLAFNYLGISHHHLFKQIEEIIMVVEVTPAEVAGELMKGTDADVSLQGLVKFLHGKMSEQEKPKN